MYLATAAVIGNLVIKRKRGTEEAKIAQDTKVCITFLLDEGMWVEPEEAKPGVVQPPLVDKTLRIELLTSLGLPADKAEAMASGSLKAELNEFIGRPPK